MLWLAHILVFIAAVAGIIYLFIPRGKIFSVCKLASGAAILAQAVWLVWVALDKSFCPLLNYWGVMAMITMPGIIFSWQASRSYSSPRILIGGLILLSVVLGIGRVFLPSPLAPDISMSWPLAFHISFSALGYAMLVVGCVTGVLILVRSRSLKSSGSDAHSDVPWSSLTALDRLFVRSVGCGILLLTLGLLLGIFVLHGASLEGPWYADPRVILTSLGCILYMAVWLQRRRRGFCSRSIVAIATLGYAFILLGFFAASLFAKGFHVF